MNNHCSTLTGARRCGARDQFDLNNARWAETLLLFAWSLFLSGHDLAAQPLTGRVVGWGSTGDIQPNVMPGTVFTNITCGPPNFGFTSDGRVVIWGGGGQPRVSLSNVVAAVPLGYGGLALRANGTLVAWSALFNPATNVPAGLNSVKAIAAGGSHALALRSDGTVVAWGDNQVGQTNVPPGLTNVVAISAGSQISVALKADGTVVAWGWQDWTNVPPGLTGVVHIAVGGATTLAIKNDGTTAAWGSMRGAATNLPPNLGNVVALGCDDYSGAALRADGTVVVWGTGDGGGFETRGLTNASRDLTNIVELSVGVQCAIAKRRDGTFVGWGYNYAYQASVPPFHTDVVSLGTGTRGGGDAYLINSAGRIVDSGFTISPNKPADLSNVVALAKGGAMGSYHNLALKADGTVVAWGDDFAGQVDVPEGLSNVVAVTAGQFHSVALRSDGQVVAWGDNGYGQTNVPAGLSGVKAISAGISFTLALRSNGTMTAWGQVPPNQPALSDVVAVSAGNAFALALRSNGRIASWGVSSASQTNVPAGLSNVVAVSAGWFHCAALKNDGKVVVWGVSSSVAPSTLAIPTGLRNVIGIASAEQGTYALVLDPKLSTIRRDGSNVVLGFRSFLGQAYQIQYSTDLAPNSWFNLPGGNMTGTGANLEVTDSNVLPGQPKRFYRLVEVN